MSSLPTGTQDICAHVRDNLLPSLENWTLQVNGHFSELTECMLGSYCSSVRSEGDGADSEGEVLCADLRACLEQEPCDERPHRPDWPFTPPTPEWENCPDDPTTFCKALAKPVAAGKGNWYVEYGRWITFDLLIYELWILCFTEALCSAINDVNTCTKLRNCRSGPPRGASPKLYIPHGECRTDEDVKRFIAEYFKSITAILTLHFDAVQWMFECLVHSGQAEFPHFGSTCLVKVGSLPSPPQWPWE